MTNYVISKKVKTFPVMRFIRNLTNHLVVDVLTDRCSGEKFDNGIQFRSTTGIGRIDPNPLNFSGRTVRKLDRRAGPLLNPAV